MKRQLQGVQSTGEAAEGIRVSTAMGCTWDFHKWHLRNANKHENSSEVCFICCIVSLTVMQSWTWGDPAFMQVTHDMWNQVSGFYACRQIKNITRRCVFLLRFSHLLLAHTLVQLWRGPALTLSIFLTVACQFFVIVVVHAQTRATLLPLPYGPDPSQPAPGVPSGTLSLLSYIFMPRCRPLHFGTLGTIGSNPHQVQSPPLDIYKLTEKMRFQRLPLVPGLLLTYTLSSLNSVGQLMPNLAPWLVSYAGFHCSSTHAKCFYEWTYLFYWRFAIVGRGQIHSSQYLLPILIAFSFSSSEREFFLSLSPSNSQPHA